MPSPCLSWLRTMNSYSRPGGEKLAFEYRFCERISRKTEEGFREEHDLLGVSLGSAKDRFRRVGEELLEEAATVD